MITNEQHIRQVYNPILEKEFSAILGKSWTTDVVKPASNWLCDYCIKNHYNCYIYIPVYVSSFKMNRLIKYWGFSNSKRIKNICIDSRYIPVFEKINEKENGFGVVNGVLKCIVDQKPDLISPLCFNSFIFLSQNEISIDEGNIFLDSMFDMFATEGSKNINDANVARLLFKNHFIPVRIYQDYEKLRLFIEIYQDKKEKG